MVKDSGNFMPLSACEMPSLFKSTPLRQASFGEGILFRRLLTPTCPWPPPRKLASSFPTLPKEGEIGCLRFVETSMPRGRVSSTSPCRCDWVGDGSSRTTGFWMRSQSSFSIATSSKSARPVAPNNPTRKMASRVWIGRRINRLAPRQGRVPRNGPSQNVPRSCLSSS